MQWCAARARPAIGRRAAGTLEWLTEIHDGTVQCVEQASLRTFAPQQVERSHCRDVSRAQQEVRCTVMTGRVSALNRRQHATTSRMQPAMGIVQRFMQSPAPWSPACYGPSSQPCDMSRARRCWIRMPTSYRSLQSMPSMAKHTCSEQLLGLDHAKAPCATPTLVIHQAFMAIRLVAHTRLHSVAAERMREANPYTWQTGIKIMTAQQER